MKQIFLSLLIIGTIIGNSFAFTPKSQYIVGDIDLSCYKQTTSITPSTGDTLHLEMPSIRDVVAFQDEKKIDLILQTSQRYIPFISNIPQTQDTEEIQGIYSFGDIDTEETREIILEFPDYDGFSSRINFSHSSQFYTPIYAISEDGETYSRISKNDMNDFSFQKLKISFIPNSDESIREVIEISALSIERVYDLIQVSPKNDAPIILYYNSICGNNEDIFLEQHSSREALIEDTQIFTNYEFIQNIFYTQRTTDSDADSIKDLYDNCIDVINRDQKDINQNTVGDACEFDADGDSIPDEIDNCRSIPNPDQKDDDGDRIGNECDNCNLYNPSQIDSDNNRIGDSCDAAKNYLAENDDDGDNIVNLEDNCPQIGNTDQTDSDNDGVGDVCDNCKAFQNGGQADLNENGIGDICEDSDSDGVDTITDNCPNIPNPDQADSDNDGVGNVCEDDDGDGVIFTEDNCPYKYNRDQLDTDGDSIGDACDEDDNRFLESNKTIFITLMILVIFIFVGGIFMVARKIQK